MERFLLLPQRQFDLEDAILEAIVPGMDLIFLCNPNNPTAGLIAPELLKQILRRCGQTGTRLVLDECFLELTDGETMAGSLAENPHLFLLRAFTKTYAVPGLRLGYGLCSDGALLERLYARRPSPWRPCPPWPRPPASPPAPAGTGRSGGREILRLQRPKLMEALGSLGCAVWEGQANYLLFRAPGVEDLKERLLEKRVLIRSCANYHGLGNDWYRVCVGQAEQNRRLLTAFKEVL